MSSVPWPSPLEKTKPKSCELPRFPLPTFINLSVMLYVTELTVVVVPLTVRSPSINVLPNTSKLFINFTDDTSVPNSIVSLCILNLPLLFLKIESVPSL